MRHLLEFWRPHVAWLRWRWALLRWAWSDDFHKLAGDPILGASREERDRNIDLMDQRHEARRPEREDFT